MSEQEMWEECHHSCDKQCDGLAEIADRESQAEDSEDDEIVEIDKSDEDQTNYIINRIGELVTESRLGNLRASMCEFWEWELVKYWVETEAEFNRRIMVKIGMVMEFILKQRLQL